MDPNYESEEDAGGGKNHGQDDYVRTRYTKFYQNGRKSVSPKKKGIEVAPIEAQNRTCEKIDVAGSNSSEKHIGRVHITNSAIGGWSDQAKLRSGSETSTATVSMGNSPSANNSETEKLWHYRDPSGKIQGPFSMVQLRKWSTTGLFPPDMRIWTHNEHCKSLLLSDALNGQFHGISEFPYYISSKALELGAVPDNRLLDGNSLGSENMNGDKYSISRTQYQMTSGCDHEGRSNNQSQLSQSSGENLRSLAADLNSNSKGSRSDLTPLARSPDSSKEGGDIYLSDLSSPTPKASSKYWEVQNAEKQQSASSDVHVQNSDILDLPSPTPSPSDEDQGDQATDTKPSLLVMNGATLPEIADKWCGYSPTPAKPSIVEWGNDLVPASSLKPPEAISGHDAIRTSNRNQHTHSSQSHLLSDFPNWQGIVDEPIEFDALSVESVSDLLAEVDAMESRSDLASSTSAMKFCKELMQDFDKELIEDCKDYCFSSIEEFRQIPDPGKSNSLSSTGEIQLTCQPTVACKPVGGLAASQVHTDPFRSSGGHSSASSLGEKRSTDTPIYPGLEAREQEA
ncbi:Zinc finger CCCH domain-containing protein 44-like [Forsythia ovata]|uniref:Zinc finger CCCH domain-containing protein 44-like n=1 Tax=Forsythia ovata TaxID=205694 RepID=A0ABD1US48_9LAMI